MHELHLQANRRHIWKQLITVRKGQLAEIGIPVWKIRTDVGYGRDAQSDNYWTSRFHLKLDAQTFCSMEEKLGLKVSF